MSGHAFWKLALVIILYVFNFRRKLFFFWRHRNNVRLRALIVEIYFKIFSDLISHIDFSIDELGM